MSHLVRGYSVVEIKVEAQDWLAGRDLAALKLSDEVVLIVGVERGNGDYQGAARGQTWLEPQDTVIMYGPSEKLTELDERRAGFEGNWDHYRTVNGTLLRIVGW